MARKPRYPQAEFRDIAVAAALRIVDAQGANALSARTLAAELDIVAGTLYRYFADFDELILATNARTLDTLIAALEQIAEKRKTPQQKLALFARTYLQTADHSGERWRLVFEHRMGSDKAIPAWYRAKTDALFMLVETQFRAAAPSASTKHSFLAARSLWAGVHGIAQLAQHDKLSIGGQVSHAKLAEELTHHFVNNWIREHGIEH